MTAAHFFKDWSGQERDYAGQGSVWRSWWMIAAFLIVSVTLASLMTHDALTNLHDRWAYEEDHGHGFPVLWVAALLLWRRWGALRALATDTRWPGLVVVITAEVGAVLGVLAQSYYLEQASFVLILLGLLMVVFGARAIMQVGPLAVLVVLAIPLPYTLQAILTVKLQLISTDIGVAIIRFIGLPVFVEGNIIDLGYDKLQVAEACSGLRYLLPLTCISFIFGLMYRAPTWKRAVVVVSAIPVTLLTNGFRLAAIAVLVNAFGSQMAEGFIHQLEGWVVFLLGGVLLAFEVLALERFNLANLQLGSLLASPTVSGGGGKPVFLGASAAVAALVCAAGLGLTAAIAWAHGSATAPERLTFAGFPHEIGEWIGKEDYLDAETLRGLKATDYYVADYSRPGASVPVNFFVSYYASLEKGGAIHSPRVCLPGSGWEFASFETKDFEALLPGTPGTFNRVIIQKGASRILMYYWIQQQERRTANEFSAKYYLLLDSITRGRQDGALVRLYSPISGPGEQPVKEAEERLTAFAREALPRTDGYLPR